MTREAGSGSVRVARPAPMMTVRGTDAVRRGML